MINKKSKYEKHPVAANQPSTAKIHRAVRREVLALRKQFMNPGIFLYYKKPIMLVEGSMQYVWDETGKRYLDGSAAS
jgi:4-aminobutyrate aminotransferase-like enzyme